MVSTARYWLLPSRSLPGSSRAAPTQAHRHRREHDREDFEGDMPGVRLMPQRLDPQQVPDPCDWTPVARAVKEPPPGGSTSYPVNAAAGGALEVVIAKARSASRALVAPRERNTCLVRLLWAARSRPGRSNVQNRPSVSRGGDHLVAPAGPERHGH